MSSKAEATNEARARILRMAAAYRVGDRSALDDAEPVERVVAIMRAARSPLPRGGWDARALSAETCEDVRECQRLLIAAEARGWAHRTMDAGRPYRVSDSVLAMEPTSARPASAVAMELTEAAKALCRDLAVAEKHRGLAVEAQREAHHRLLACARLVDELRAFGDRLGDAPSPAPEASR